MALSLFVPPALMVNTEKQPITSTATIAMLTLRFTMRSFLALAGFFEALTGIRFELMFTTTKSSSTVKKSMVDRAYSSGFTPFFSSVYSMVESVFTPAPFVK